MAELYKILGQLAPSATTNTDLYTVPADTYAVCSSIVVCNRGSTGTFRVAIREDGDAIANEHYIYYDADISANDTGVFNLGLSLSETDVVTVYTSSADMSFNLFGVELDDTTVGIGSSEVDKLILSYLGATQVSWTNMPLALTEFLGQTHRKIVDLSQYDDVRLMVCRGTASSAAAVNAELRAQYSTDSGGSWNYFDGSTGPAVNINYTSSVQASAWTTMQAPAKANVQVRIVGITGDGAIDPNFTQVDLEFR